MQFSFDSNNLTDLDRALLAVVLGAEIVLEPAKDVEPAKTPKPAAKAEPKAAPAKAAPKVEDEPTEGADDDDLMGSDNGGPVSREDVVAMASALLSRGGSADLKKALATVGAKRVSEIGDDDLARFAKLLG